ncbi:MAG: efflux RND transporter periplasmic adaptor subunit [Proteobacteria bacterium]|nr:efflux RND transporter periplasmic adaptor subunit [Pseudomonadota bacterium]
MKLKYAVCCGILVLFTLFAVACTEEEAPKKEIVRPVKYQQVFLSGGQRQRTFTGVSKSATETKLSFRVSGILQSIKVKVGRKVEKGSLIAVVDDSDARLNYGRTEEEYKNTKVQYQTAKSNLSRFKSLYENNSVSLNDYESAKNRHALSKANFESAKKRLDLQAKELGYYKLYAPTDGIVAGKEVEVNENIKTGQVVFLFNSGDEVEIVVGIPESFISGIKTGQDTTVAFPSFAGKVFDGTVTEVSYAVNSQSRMYPVTVQLARTASEIRPGMTANVTFSFVSERQESAILVAANAVGKDTAGNYVFTVEETEKGLAAVHKIPVTVGRLTRKGFEIRQGLQSGDLVVTAGISKLSEGMKVKLLK